MGLKLIGYWNIALLKNTIQWFLLSGTANAIYVVTSSDPNQEFKRIVLANLKIIVFLEFITNTYTFPLWLEIILLPVATFVAILDIVAKSDKQYASVSKITSAIQIMAALAIIYFAARKAISDYQNLLSIESLRNIALAPIYTFLTLPFLYVFMLVSLYERLFILLKHGKNKNKSLIRYGKTKIFLHLGFNFKKIRNFQKAYGLKLIQIENKSDVDDLFR